MNEVVVNENLEGQSFDSRVARALSLWCMVWMIVFLTDYMELTWRFIAELGGFQWILVVSPAFWLWVATFSVVLLMVHRLMQLPWHRFERGLSLTKAGTLIATLPIVLWFTLHEAIPYFYPALDGFVRLVPFLGGKGYA